MTPQRRRYTVVLLAALLLAISCVVFPSLSPPAHVVRPMDSPVITSFDFDEDVAVVGKEGQPDPDHEPDQVGEQEAPVPARETKLSPPPMQPQRTTKQALAVKPTAHPVAPVGPVTAADLLAQFTVENGLVLLHKLDMKIRAEILATQRPASCTSSRLVAMSAGPTGFASMWEQYVQTLLAAHSVVNGSLVVQGGGGKGKALDCFFELPGNCSVVDLTALPQDRQDARRNLTLLADQSKHRVVSLSASSDFLLESTEDKNLDYYPPKYRYFGLPFWRIRVNKFLLDSLLPDVRTAIEARMAQWPQRGTPMIGMHIHRGDNVTERYPLDAYLKRALKLQKAHGAKHLVVATDSAKELDTIMSLPKWTSQFQIIYVNETVTQPDGNKQVMDSLSNLYMLSETNYFVGFAHSNLARVAVDWIDAKNNLLAPVEWIEFELGQDGKQRSTDGRRTPLSSLYYAHYNHTAILEQVWCYRRHIAGLDMPPSHCK